MKILDKVEKLIALTNSPNENEANAAARRVCNLIQKHSLTLRLETSRRNYLRVVHAYRTQRCEFCRRMVTRDTSAIWDEFTNDIFHINCFLDSLRDLNKDLGNPDMDLEYDYEDDDGY